MIKNFALLLTLFLTSSIVFCQHSMDTISDIYIPIKTYREDYDKENISEDSLDYFFRGKDTLVLVKNFFPPKGIRVPYEYKDDSFLKYYKKIAFPTVADSVKNKVFMKYWKEEIKIFFSKSVSRTTRKDFMNFAKNIDNQVDSLKIKRVKNIEDSNYIIYYSGDYEYESALRQSTKTTFYQFWNGENQITRTSLKIDLSRAFNEDLIIYELKKNFFQTLGYFHLTDEFTCNSYFSNCFSNEKTITPFDLKLLQYHYSYGICKGISLAYFEETHQRMKKRLKEDPRAEEYFIHN